VCVCVCVCVYVLHVVLSLDDTYLYDTYMNVYGNIISSLSFCSRSLSLSLSLLLSLSSQTPTLSPSLPLSLHARARSLSLSLLSLNSTTSIESHDSVVCSSESCNNDLNAYIVIGNMHACEFLSLCHLPLSVWLSVSQSLSKDT
jgi:hypothetical protein